MTTKHTIIKKLLFLLSTYKKEFFLSFILTIIISLIGVIESLFLSYLIDSVLYSDEKTTLITIAIIIFLTTLFQISLKTLKNLLIQQISYKLDIDLTKKFYNTVLQLQFAFFETHKTGDLISRINDARTIRNTLSEGIISIISNIIMFLLVGITLFKLNASLFFIQITSIIIFSIIVFKFGKFFSKSYQSSMEKYADFQAFITESFSGIMAIKTNSSLKTFKKQLKKRQNNFIQTNWNISEYSILQNSYCSSIEKLTYILLLVFGCLFVIKETMSIGQIASFMTLSVFFSNSIVNILDLQPGIQESFAAIKRLFEVMNETSEDNVVSKLVKNVVPRIEFKDVTFYYKKDRIIFNKLNINIKPGEWISFIGKTGCGKTTFTKLILKLYKPQNGIILWNNEDIQNLNTDSIRKSIAYVPQDIIIFSGTIFDNITMFDETISKDNVIEITKKVGIYEKISTLEKGFNTVIGERGFSLSGGERQKIAICRALIKNPQVIIIDEATSNLDTLSEKEFISIIEQQKKEGKTIISITHRLSTSKKCDKIYVLDNGNIVEEGNFYELKKKKGILFSMLNIC